MNQAPALTPPAGALRHSQSVKCGLKPRYARLGGRDETQMSIAALFAWMITIFAGLILLMIWIIEYDREFQNTAATRLPVPVISVHALLGLGGLTLWIGYLLVDEERLAWAAVALLSTVAVLGLIMAARWVGVYRTFAAPGPSLTSRVTVPPERNFPLPVVVGHGILAVTTLVLVLFTALRGT
jgi:hypothetical protein